MDYRLILLVLLVFFALVIIVGVVLPNCVCFTSFLGIIALFWLLKKASEDGKPIL